MDGLDLKKLAAEVSAEHGIRIDPDDPIMAVITLNRLVFEEAVERAVTRLQESANEIDKAAGRLQVRAGTVIAQELKECALNFERQVRAAAEATLSARQAKRLIHANAAWFTLGLAAALLLFLLGAYFGVQHLRPVLSGG